MFVCAPAHEHVFSFRLVCLCILVCDVLHMILELRLFEHRSVR
jgi:hypothetical protein